jgi:hypothetical protein
MMLKHGYFRKQIRKVLKCGAGEVWRRSDAPIVYEMKYNIVKNKKNILHAIKGRSLTELVTFRVGTAF